MKKLFELEEMVKETNKAMEETQREIDKLEAKLKQPTLNTHGFIEYTERLNQKKELAKSLKNRKLALNGTLAKAKSRAKEMEEERKQALEEYNQAMQPLRDRLDDLIEYIQQYDFTEVIQAKNKYNDIDYFLHKEIDKLPQKQAKSLQDVFAEYTKELTKTVNRR